MNPKLLLGQTAGRSFFAPESASTFAGDVDWVFNFIFYVSLLFFAIIVGCMFAFLVKYRRRRPGESAQAQITHNTPLEILWSVVPGVLLIFMFWWGFRGFMEMRTIPDNAYEINVNAYQWAWEFQYPGGITHDELHVPQDRPVRLIMGSQDVIHSLFIPAFRAKRDVVPGRYSDLWFIATEPGTYPLLCAEYCGTGHSDMNTVCVVHGPGEFAKWLETADPLRALPEDLYAEYLKDPQAFIDKYKNDPQWGSQVSRLETPAMIGEQLYKKKACTTCHTIDGSVGQAPSFKGIFTRQRVFADGSTLPPDMNIETYIRESIMEPNARKVAGYTAIMPKISLTNREIDALIAFIKKINNYGPYADQGSDSPG
jgi:cytochrome c oxidase subunit 2